MPRIFSLFLTGFGFALICMQLKTAIFNADVLNSKKHEEIVMLCNPVKFGFDKLFYLWLYRGL